MLFDGIIVENEVYSFIYLFILIFTWILGDLMWELSLAN